MLNLLTGQQKGKPHAAEFLSTKYETIRGSPMISRSLLSTTEMIGLATEIWPSSYQFALLHSGNQIINLHEGYQNIYAQQQQNIYIYFNI